MSSSTFSSGGGTILAGDYSAARDININITNVPKATLEDKKISSWFSRLNFWTTYQDTLGRRHEGTGSWFLRHERFLKWQQDGHKTLLCTGIPGSGKTVLSAIVVEHLLKSRMEDHTIAVACIYCNYKDRQPAVNLLSSLVKQILQQMPTIPDHVKSIFEDHNERQTQPALNEYHDILRSVSGEFSKVFLIVDGLDEYDKNEIRTLIKVLSQVSGLRLLTFSRDVPYVKHHFLEFPQVEIQASERDIESYLDARIQSEFELSELIQEDPPLYDKIRATIVGKSGGMFLLAHLHLESLVEYDNRGAICAALESLPTELHVSYGEAMKRIEKQSESDRMRAKQVLLWISCTLRPIKIEELREALVIRGDSSTLDRDTLPVGSRLISICAGLVRIDQQSQIIKLAHETIQEYFKLKRSHLFPDAEKTIATACLTYLSFNTFEVGMCSTDQDLEDLLKHNPFLDYASRYWGVHIRGDLEINLIKLSLRFLQSDLRTSCSSQVMFVDAQNLSGYSQMVPWKISGTHIGAHFNLACTLAALLQIQPKSDIKDSNGRTPLSWAASLGNDEAVLLLMHQEGTDVNSEDRHGQTPLSRAAEEGHENVVKLLLKHKDLVIDCRDGWGMTPLAWTVAGSHWSIAKLLLDKGADINTADDDGETAFFKAVEKKDKAVIRLLLEKGAHIPADDDSGINALAWAVERRDWGTVRLLVQSGVNPNKRLGPGITVLNEAVRDGQRDVVELLIRENAVINPRKTHDQAPLWTAVTSGQFGMIETLLELGANADVKDPQGGTLLHWAVESGRADLLPMLVAYGAAIEATNRDGQNALWLAVKNHREELLPVLRRLGANFEAKNSEGMTPIRWAVEHDRKILRLLVELGSCVDATDQWGDTALHWAVRHNCAEAVDELVSLGANAEITDVLDRTALHWAAEAGHEELVTRLMDLRIDLNARDVSGRTSLLCAVLSKHLGVVAILLQAGADASITDLSKETPYTHAVKTRKPDLLNLLFTHKCKLEGDSWGKGWSLFTWSEEDLRWFVVELTNNPLATNCGMTAIFEGYTPLHIAADKGYLDVLEQLLRARCFRADSKLDDGQMPIHLATQYGHLEIVKRLLQEECVNINAQSNNGTAPLHVAARHGHLRMVEYLLQQEGVIAQIKDAEGWTPMHFAIHWAHLHVMKGLLCVEHVDVNVQTNNGWTPLHITARHGNYRIVDFLLHRKDVIPNIKAKDGCTPLHFAALKGHRNSVERLLRAKQVKADVKSNEGRTPAQLASENGHFEVAQVLDKYQAESRRRSK